MCGCADFEWADFGCADVLILNVLILSVPMWKFAVVLMLQVGGFGDGEVVRAFEEETFIIIS
jgi:uncharacterized membrane protein